MSVQAMSWALSLPTEILKDSSARHVLLCLANYAGSNGTGAFPSASTLAQDTGLSERTVRYKLDDLEQSGLIKKGNQAIAAVHIDRHDRRPVVYDLQILRGVILHPVQNGVQMTQRGAIHNRTGCSLEQNGVQPLHPIHHLTIKEPKSSCSSAKLMPPSPNRTTQPSNRRMIASASPCSPHGARTRRRCRIRSQSQGFLLMRFLTRRSGRSSASSSPSQQPSIPRQAGATDWFSG